MILLKNKFAYLKYFFYLAINWNFRLAWFIILKEISGEKKFNINTTGVDDLSLSVAAADREHASIYQPVNFYSAEKLFENIDKKDIEGSFLDIGCGKGRALIMAAEYGFKNIIGIDFSPQLCHDAIALCDQIETTYPKSSVTIECEDAREFPIPDSVSVIFMFNPFDDLVMMDFIKQVRNTLKKHPRKLKLMYANPQCKKQWITEGFEETVYFKKMKYLDGSVLVFQP